MIDHLHRDNDCDVLILGASLAGGCLARQLKLAMPELRIINIDKKTDFDYWVGEATVPPWTDYAVRHCGLGPYLWKRHMMKHGVRFFFDSAAKDLHLWQMAEFGRQGYPPIASFMIERSTFDRDVCAMNRDLGIDVRLGTRVMRAENGSGLGIEIDPDGGHVVHTSGGTIRARWLVDAMGHQALLARQLGLLQPDWERLPTSSYWARFARTSNIDSLGSDEWRMRVGYSERNLSGNHYMYQGYWIWQLPVDEDVISLGVTLDERLCPERFKNAEQLLAFLRQHQCMRDLLGEDTRAVDFFALTRLPRHSSHFCSTDRWFMTGMSASFIDPMFSSNCMSIAAHNLLIEALIQADRQGQGDLFESRVAHFNVFHEVFHRANMAAIDYQRHASFDGWVMYRYAMLNNLVNWAPPMYYRDLRDLVAMADANVGRPVPSADKLFAMRVEGGFSGAIRRRKDEFVDYLLERGLYHDGNQEQFFEGTSRESARRHLWSQFGDPAVIADKKREDLVSYAELMHHYASRMAEIEGVPWSETAFAELLNQDVGADQTVRQLVDAMASHHQERAPLAGRARPAGDESVPTRAAPAPA